MIYLVLDFFLSYVSIVPTFFFLMNIVTIKKIDYPKFLIILLIYDILILNTYFLNTIICSILFFLYKKLKITKRNLKNLLFSMVFIYFLYILMIGIWNGYSVLYLLSFMMNNCVFNFLFYGLCYKIKEKNIQLARW